MQEQEVARTSHASSSEEEETPKHEDERASSDMEARPAPRTSTVNIVSELMKIRRELLSHSLEPKPTIKLINPTPEAPITDIPKQWQPSKFNEDLFWRFANGLSIEGSAAFELPPLPGSKVYT